jgi:hypothetical protein
VIRMMWLNKMKMAAGVVLAVALAGTSIAFVVRQTWAGGDEQVQREQPAPQGAKRDAKASTQEDSKAEIADLRKEIARLRDEVKLLAARQQVNARQDSGPTYRGKSTAFWLNQLNDVDPKYLAEAIDALGVLARKNKALIPVLITALNDEPTNIRVGDTIRVANTAENAIAALWRFGQEVVPMLIEVLRDKSSPTGQRNAGLLLSRIGPKAKAAVPLFIKGLQDNNLRWVAIDALGNIGPDAKSAIPSLIDLLGPSIQAFKERGDKEGWSKLDPNRRLKIPQELPDAILDALVRIDPEIENVLASHSEGPFAGGLPRRSTYMTSNYKSLVARWQKDYEALKKRYPPEK